MPDWTHNCDVCGRGWHQDEKGNWHSHFATDVEIYSPDGKKIIYNSTRDEMMEDEMS
jgi:hypothetical protein